MNKEVILTGIRANNDLHIGNYFGALLPIVDMAKNKSEQYQINLFVPDLHSFTTPIDHSKLYEQTMHNLKIFVAAGLPLDNDNIHIYRQSYISAHSELTWILDCFTGFGQLFRMTQFREKSGVKEDINFIAGEQPTAVKLQMAAEQGTYNDQRLKNISVGLFNYPALMAADILLYGAKYVPVGDDQTQHLEFTRDIAERMNNQFGGLFVVPEPVAKQHEFFGKDQGLRIKDLVDPTKKMSKSDELGKGVIFMGDNPDEAAKKIMSATTDSVGKISYDTSNQPGISNLLQILGLLKGEDLQQTAAKYEGKTSYGELKQDVALAIKDFLQDFQAKLDQVDTQALQAKLQASEAKMNDSAGKTLYKVQQAVGLRPSDVE